MRVELNRMAMAANNFNDVTTILVASLPALNFLRLHIQPGADPANVKLINTFIDLLNKNFTSN